MLSPNTKLVAMVHVSNMLGCILPAAQVAEAAHKVTPHAQSCPVAAPLRQNVQGSPPRCRCMAAGLPQSDCCCMLHV